MWRAFTLPSGPLSSGRTPPPPDHLPLDRLPPAPDTDPIDLRDLARSFPPRPAEVYQPFADGRRPRPPSPQGVTMTLIGAPIPHAGVADPEPPRRPVSASVIAGPVMVGLGAAAQHWRPRWSPRRRRRFARTVLGVGVLVSVVLVLVAGISVLAD